jgi:hypothetical protein
MITPHDTAQYGHVLRVSVVRAILNARISARADAPLHGEPVDRDAVGLREASEVGPTQFARLPSFQQLQPPLFALHEDFRPERRTASHQWAIEHGATFVDTGLWKRAQWFARLTFITAHDMNIDCAAFPDQSLQK